MADRHIKSGDTSVSVGNSKAELERILLRYGCSAFGVMEDYDEGIVHVQFKVSDTPGEPATIPVKLKIDIQKVEDALDDAGYRLTDGRAERVAWRNLVLWVDSACSAAAVNLRPMSQAFFADLVVTGDDGRQQRMFDLMGPEVQKRLVSGE